MAALFSLLISQSCENFTQLLSGLLEALMRFLFEIASILFLKDNNHLPATRMDTCTHYATSFFW